MPNAKKEKELCLGIKKISAPRPYKGVVNKKYYEPMYGSKSCTYSGAKRGRKTISEKLEQKESQIKFTRKHGDFIFYFD
tara:strand:- start:793 stop:1029 length:237 start_codon:yes stop_codon:yes gene_type:complete